MIMTIVDRTCILMLQGLRLLCTRLRVRGRYRLASMLWPLIARPGLYVDLPFGPRIRLPLNVSEPRLQAKMFLGTYAALQTEWLRRTLPRDGVFLDVGANIGYFSALAASMGAEVHAFEPHPSYAERLRMLAQRASNAGARIHVNQLALGSECGYATLYVSSVNLGGSTMVASALAPQHVEQVIQVEVTTLDVYAREHDLSRVDLIKIDVEGLEYAVIRGATHLLRGGAGRRPVVMCEICQEKMALRGDDPLELVKDMSHWGYTMWTFDSKGLVRSKPSSLGRVQDVVFVPQDKLSQTVDEGED